MNASVLCPGLVRTNIGTCQRHRPAELCDEPVTPSPEMQAGRAAFELLIAASTPPAKVADAVFDAIQKGQFYIITHPEWLEVIRLRTSKLLAMENPENASALIAKMLHFY